MSADGFEIDDVLKGLHPSSDEFGDEEPQVMELPMVDDGDNTSAETSMDSDERGTAKALGRGMTKKKKLAIGLVASAAVVAVAVGLGVGLGARDSERMNSMANSALTLE
eukprot:CAMPEP_0183742084 /NCGR_PEP_ID=MMETSP0737-20130205/63878_1 /TAXON_ID=385413 /ORGANISM="Thalassiosira miniscula, Strain CCMP1093" /LENGTH=108 /DNA_ID=CAMNT_0025977607 /DNA_START=38 /DNA_END=361 /DNA_ORIENTATION=-